MFISLWIVLGCLILVGAGMFAIALWFSWQDMREKFNLDKKMRERLKL